jgi:capping protein (actin filament) muscle Z-line, beta
VSETSPHIANIGRMIEDMENKIRNTLNEIYFGKTKDVVNGEAILRRLVPSRFHNFIISLGLRSVDVLADQKQKAAMKQDLANAILRRNAKNE